MTNPPSALPQTLDHFERLYSASDDPWRVRDSWYEQRKRALILAGLPHARFANAYEPGCGNGELSAALASRCERLLASDASDAAVRLARARLADRTHVTIAQHVLPAQWPAGERGPFDLIVISELAYYLEQADLDRLIGATVTSLAGAGTLALCHWRHDFDDRQLGTAAIHDAFAARPELARTVRHAEHDFLLDIWTREAA